jgi:rare lipoprotein A (peptidoglycan hydrolase)
MKVRIAFSLFCLAAAMLLPAEEIWEGNAAVIRRGVFESPGLYAASDSFPKDSLILVENIQNGKQVEVSILQRINGSGNVFLLLSDQAAAQIGLTADEVLPVRASIILSPASGVIGLPDDLPKNPDPDIDPTAGVPELAAPPEPSPAAGAAVAQEPVEEAPAAEAAVALVEEAEPAAEEPAAQAEAEEAAVPEVPPTALEAAPSPVAEEQLSPEQQRLTKVASRLPQKQTYMPPREDERFVVVPEQEPGPEVAAALVEEVEPPAEEPAAEEPPAEAEAEEAELSLAAAADTQVEETELDMPGLDQIEAREARGLEAQPAAPPEIVSAPAPVPALPEEPAAEEEPDVVEEALPEESFQLAELFEPPPEAPVEERAPGDLPLVETLPPEAYFLQLAAYSGRQRVEKLVSDLQPTYTVAVLPVMRQNRQLYKVLIGPLNQEESGTLLYRFRSLGYKDAFITQSD